MRRCSGSVRAMPVEPRRNWPVPPVPARHLPVSARWPAPKSRLSPGESPIARKRPTNRWILLCQRTLLRGSADFIAFFIDAGIAIQVVRVRLYGRDRRIAASTCQLGTLQLVEVIDRRLLIALRLGLCRHVHIPSIARENIESVLFVIGPTAVGHAYQRRCIPTRRGGRDVSSG